MFSFESNSPLLSKLQWWFWQMIQLWVLGAPRECIVNQTWKKSHWISIHENSSYRDRGWSSILLNFRETGQLFDYRHIAISRMICYLCYLFLYSSRVSLLLEYLSVELLHIVMLYAPCRYASKRVDENCHELCNKTGAIYEKLNIISK